MMANLAYVLKLFQFGMIASLLFYFDMNEGMEDDVAKRVRADEVIQRLCDPLYAVPGFALVGFGQMLNMRVYQLLGENGVYYGSKLTTTRGGGEAGRRGRGGRRRRRRRRRRREEEGEEQEQGVQRRRHPDRVPRGEHGQDPGPHARAERREDGGGHDARTGI